MISVDVAEPFLGLLMIGLGVIIFAALKLAKRDIDDQR